jgi:hypothetical protein
MPDGDQILHRSEMTRCAIQPNSPAGAFFGWAKVWPANTCALGINAELVPTFPRT